MEGVTDRARRKLACNPLHLAAWKLGMSDSCFQAGDPKAKKTSAAAAASSTPLVTAARQRAKTARSLGEAERLLKKAVQEASTLLTVTAPTVLPEGVDADSDPTLELIRNRLALANLGQDDAGGKEGLAQSQRLYALALEDPYLRDCQATLLQNREAVQTLGAIFHCRKFTMDLYLAKSLSMYALDLLVSVWWQSQFR